MMFAQSQDEAHRHQQAGYDEQHRQQSFLQSTHPQHQALNESEEDAALAADAGGGGDGQSSHSTVVDYAESDLRDVDADTKLLIAHLTDLDVSVACNKKRVFFTMLLLTIVCCRCFLTHSAQSNRTFLLLPI